MRYFLNCNIIAAVLFFYFNPVAIAESPKIAIVIDDMGYRSTDRAAIQLKGQFTFAIVPFAPLTKQLAVAAYDSDREVIAHLPMEATRSNHLLGKGALLTSMDEAQTRAQINQSLDNIPHIRGLNNHMGSKYTAHSQSLQWLMDELNQRNLYFLDSLTTPLSIAERSATQSGLKTAHRHIFLDNQLDNAYLTTQFNRLISIAHSNGYAIAIAHPHPETVSFLNNIEGVLAENNIELVPLSTLLPRTTAQARRVHFSQSAAGKATIKQTAPN